MNDTRFHTWWLACCLVLFTRASAGPIFVDVDATGVSDGSTWADAFTSLSAAIGKATVGDEVWVAEGTYGPIRLKSGVTLYGGFRGSETTLAEAEPGTHRTFVSGQGTSRAIECSGCDSSTVVRGFHIIKGFIDLPDTGGGVYLEESDTVFVQCVFTENRAVTLGGAVTIWGGSPSFVNCRFHGNDGGWAAGAVFSRKSATPTFVNCLFYDNKAGEAGAISVRTGAPRFVNCTIADNQATSGKGGALFDACAGVTLENCILWNNASPVLNAGEIFSMPAGEKTTRVDHSVVKGGWAGNGNLDKDPLFVDAAKGDYRLQVGSPCRDKGLNTALPTDATDLSLDGNTTETLPKDLGFKARVNGDAVDLGAFEWHP
jgi:hypothetical protein